ncbi:hypothetical protein ACA910_005551 [Epithemia clementina (nom. ined.)]
MLDFTTPGKPAIGSVITGKAPVSSMSFHSSGQRLFLASEQDSKLHVVDCWQKGKEDRPPLKLERETIRLVHATHHEDCVLCTKSTHRSLSSSSSTSSSLQPPTQQHAINYLSVYDNKILRKFRGHTDVVRCLSQSPENDTFLSSSQDQKVRLWTLQSPACLAECVLPSHGTNSSISSSSPQHASSSSPLAVFDSTGLVFGITAPILEPVPSSWPQSQSSLQQSLQQSLQLQGFYLHLYDARNHGAGAFAELKIPHADLVEAITQASAAASASSHPIPMMMTLDRATVLAQQPWTSMQFNAAGTQILIGSALGVAILLDGFEGTIQKVLLSHTCTTSTLSQIKKTVACFTADDKYVLMGNDDGTIDCWNVETGTVLRRLETGAAGTTSIDELAFNPAYSQFACAASRDVGLWIWK